MQRPVRLTFRFWKWNFSLFDWWRRSHSQHIYIYKLQVCCRCHPFSFFCLPSVVKFLPNLVYPTRPEWTLEGRPASVVPDLRRRIDSSANPSTRRFTKTLALPPAPLATSSPKTISLPQATSLNTTFIASRQHLPPRPPQPQADLKTASLVLASALLRASASLRRFLRTRLIPSSTTRLRSPCPYRGASL